MRHKSGGGHKTVFLAAGGTGGHVFPAQALAAELRARGCDVHMLTDARARRFVRAEQFVQVHCLQSATFAALSPWAVCRSLWRIARGFASSLRLMRREKPALLVGFGGYPTVPPLLAARLLGVPIMIHEQNSVMGRANRLGARLADSVALGFPPARGSGGKYAAKTHIAGNPLRAEVLAAVAKPYQPAKAGAPFHLLVFGGSQGASFFAEIMPQALALLPPAALARLRLTQQARAAEIEPLRSAYAAMGLKAELAPFFSDMAAKMAEAQFVIARAGASTVAEIAAIGRPALLVPYPNALDHDQRHNARALAAGGGAELAEQAALTPQKLAGILTLAMSHPQMLAQKAAAAYAAGERGATEKLAAMAESLMRAKRK